MGNRFLRVALLVLTAGCEGAISDEPPRTGDAGTDAGAGTAPTLAPTLALTLAPTLAPS